MPAYPNYSTPMNNGYGYNQQMQMQNPYVDRMNFLQNYQQGLQQPLQQQGQVFNQQQTQPIPSGINGKFVQNVESITANDVPMDGSAAVFPKQDMSEIYIKYWENNGTIRTIVFKPFWGDEPNNSSQQTENLKIGLSEDVTGAFMERFDSLENKINELMSKSTTKPMTSKSKKEAAESE